MPHVRSALFGCALFAIACHHPPRLTAAAKLTSDNFDAEHIPGPASLGLPGDYFLRNANVRFVIQAPNRDIGPAPFGGTLIDADFVAAPAGDQIGELAPFFGVGRTADFTSVSVVKDGSDGGEAIIEATGPDTNNDFINIRGIGQIAEAIIDEAIDPRIPLGLTVTARYVLAPDADFLRIDYRLDNAAATERATSFGTITDTGAAIELFHPGLGYGEIGVDLFTGTGGVPVVEYAVLQGEGISYGIVSDETDPSQRAAPLPIGGQAVEVYNERSFTEAIGTAGSTMKVPAGGSAAKTVYVDLVRGGPGEVEGRVRRRRRSPVGGVDGSVTGSVRGGTRIAIFTPQKVLDTVGLVTTFVGDAHDRFSGELAPGSYVAVAESEGWLRSVPVPFTVAADARTPLALELPKPAKLAYRIRDLDGNSIPGKVSVVGAAPNPPHRAFRDTVKDPWPYGLAAWRASLSGDWDTPNGFDGALVFGPGKVRVVVSRGPEWSRYEEVVDLPPDDFYEVTATLARVVDTTGYVSADFHQHSHLSPDSPISPEERVITNLADGNELLSSSEHDRIFDYAPIVDALGVGDRLSTGIGIESTPFDYGHFNAYPLTVDPLRPSGGAVDWGNRGDGLAPSEIFAAFFDKGAAVVQVNHPRVAPGGVPYQQNFDRAALTFDWEARSFGSDVSALELSPRALGLVEGAPLFSPTFNAVELMLGFHPGADPTVADRERTDTTTMSVLRDWMSFLSMGFVVTAVGDSDTHQRWSVPTGMPRTLVRVPDDSAAAIAAGIGDDVYATIAGSRPRDVIVSSGPIIRAYVGDAATGGIGRVVVVSGQPTLHVEVQAADWVGLDEVEVYANATFTIPPPAGQQADPLVPVYCYTTRTPVPTRCAGAVGGARGLVVTSHEVAPGHARVETSLDVALDLEAIAKRTRSGATGKDVWLVVVAKSRRALFPVVPTDLDPDDATIDELVAGTVLENVANQPLAITNPIFLDVDGSGWRAPFAP